VTRTVHRLIERHAATNGDAIAIIDGDSSYSYRELNAAANVLARRLIAAGFRHGMRAQVEMAPSVDLAVILLAILKAGGSYLLFDDDPAGHRQSPSLLIHESAGEHRELHIGELSLNGACGPNLPVITRETEIAFVIDGGADEDAIAVPHATVVAMASCADGTRSPWTRESGVFDLWVALMSGATAAVNDHRAVAA
jgi:non-ribosomal peptide synthetase component F